MKSNTDVMKEEKHEIKLTPAIFEVRCLCPPKTSDIDLCDRFGREANGNEEITSQGDINQVRSMFICVGSIGTDGYQ